MNRPVAPVAEPESIFTETRKNLLNTGVIADALFKGSTKRENFEVVTSPDRTSVSGPDTSLLIEREKDKIFVFGYNRKGTISIMISSDKKAGEVGITGYTGDFNIRLYVRNHSGNMQIRGGTPVILLNDLEKWTMTRSRRSPVGSPARLERARKILRIRGSLSRPY